MLPGPRIPAVLFAAIATQAQAQPVPLPKDFVPKAQALIEAYAKANRFTGSVLIALDGKVVLRKAYGFADYSTHTPMTPETPIPLFSVSKSFTAGAILRLQEKGLLSVTDKASKYLADLPAAWQDITLHQLLTHSSGMGIQDQMDWYKVHFGHPIGASSEVPKLPPTKPGSTFAYSNVGYVILGEIVSKVSGKPFDTFLQEAIFTPLHMTGAGTGGHWEDQKQVARGHRLFGGKLIPSDQRLSIIRGAGNVHANVDDLLKWRNAIDSPGFFSEDSRKALHTPFIPVGSEVAYSYGWFYHNQWPYWEHSGGGASCETSVAWLPERKITIVILKNSDDSAGDLFSTGLISLAYAQKPFIEKFVDFDRLDRYQGVYRDEKGQSIVVSFENETLSLKLPNTPSRPTEYAGGTKYQASGIVADFQPRKDGLFDLRLVLNGKTTRHVTRLTASKPLSEYAGEYGDATGDVTFAVRNGRLALLYLDASVNPEPFLIALYPSGNDRFIVPNLDAEVRFTRNAQGKIVALQSFAHGKLASTTPRKSPREKSQ